MSVLVRALVAELPELAVDLAAGGLLPQREVLAHLRVARRVAPPPIRLEWLTVDQTAELVGVSRRTIRRWLDDGRLTGRRHGRAWDVDATAVARLRRSWP